MWSALFLNVLVEAIVNSLESRGAELINFSDVVRGLVHVGIAEHHDHTFGFGIDQPTLGTEHRNESAFAAHERTRNVEPAVVFIRNELVEVVTGHPARNWRIFFADQSRVTLAQRFQQAINVSHAP